MGLGALGCEVGLLDCKSDVLTTALYYAHNCRKVDVCHRLRHPEMLFNILETTHASYFKFYHHVALDGLCISTENDVTVYFWLAANRINEVILDHVRVVISG